ncbi:MAG: response regulator [Chloroflexi bacterium]|nr:response regulator [Chloroflexota bacterium]
MHDAISILIVDGDAHNLMTLSALLKTLEIGFKRNTTGVKVVEQARAMYPRLDAILINVSLPDADAFALCRALKTDSVLAALPLIAIADTLTDELREKVRRAGFAGLVVRPIPRRQFASYLRRIISGERSNGV